MLSKEQRFEKIYSELTVDKLKLRSHQCITKEKFLSFLTVDVKENKNCFGYDTWWREYRGENGLIISCGQVMIDGEKVELLDSVKYKKQLMSRYNDFINPFFMLEIL